MICCTQISQPTIPVVEIEHHVEHVIRPTLSSHEIRPHLALHEKALMTICMALSIQQRIRATRLTRFSW